MCLDASAVSISAANSDKLIYLTFSPSAFVYTGSPHAVYDVSRFDATFSHTLYKVDTTMIAANEPICGTLVLGISAVDGSVPPAVLSYFSI